jgi:poly(A) polymerase
LTQSFNSNRNPHFFLPPQIKILFSILNESGDEIRIIGGSVRNFLANKKSLSSEKTDFDLACRYPPEKTLSILKKNHIKTVATALKYGTVTAFLDQEQFQITTLRRDIKNFGRDCEVEFIDNFFEDARRRDFTINAISIDASGQIYDYFGGKEDLKNEVVRFIGEADERIKEDYLRILRFFRFSCKYAKNLDLKALAACIKYKNYLNGLSSERIKTEFFKIIECSNRSNLLSVLQIMNDGGILKIICGCDSQKKISALKNLFSLEKIIHIQYEALTIFSIISENNPPKIALSNKEKKYLRAINLTQVVHRDKQGFNQLLHDIDFRISEKNLIKLLLTLDKKELTEIYTVKLVMSDNFENLIDDFLRIRKIINSIQIPYFPVNGHDLIALKINPQDIGKALKISKLYWCENNFSPTKEQIISFVNSSIKNHIKLSK